MGAIGLVSTNEMGAESMTKLVSMIGVGSPSMTGSTSILGTGVTGLKPMDTSTLAAQSNVDVC
jgi:hypothetical protein